MHRLAIFSVVLIVNLSSPTADIHDEMGYSRKKSNMGGAGGRGGGGLRIWNFQGYQTNRMWNFQGLSRMKCNFQRRPRKNNVELTTFFVLGLEFPKDLTKFCGVSRGWALFCLEFPGAKWKNENFQGVFRKVYP